MGIANPVTRETHGSGTHYHLQLAKQLGDMLQAPLEVGVIFIFWGVGGWGGETGKKEIPFIFTYLLLFYSLHDPLSLTFFLPLPTLTGTWRYDGSYRGVLSRQSC